MQSGGSSLILRVLVLVATLMAIIAVNSAMAADACAAAPATETEQAMESAEPWEDCPDCGPTCETGCCHALHTLALVGEQPDLSRPSHEATRTWPSPHRWPLPQPSGPDRPPRD